MSDITVKTTTRVIEPVIQEIKTKQINQHLIVNPADRSVAVVLGGPPGPRGPEGPPGQDGRPISYVHTQIPLSASWVIDHNLGFYPNVTVEEVDTGRVIMGSEIHHSVNQMEIQFNSPRAGIARLS